MASISLSLCSSLTSQCRISLKSQNPGFFNPNISFLSVTSHKPHLSFAARPTFPLLLKSSVSEAAVVEAEIDAPEPESTTDAPELQVTTAVVEASAEPARKREEVFAVVMVSSWSYFVATQLESFLVFLNLLFTCNIGFLVNGICNCNCNCFFFFFAFSFLYFKPFSSFFFYMTVFVLFLNRKYVLQILTKYKLLL